MTHPAPVLLFVVDGMRPDGMLRADTPVMNRLRAAGAHTLAARSVMPSMTLPCHMSLFHSVLPGRHGITTNVWTPPVRPVAGLFDLLHHAGRVTASFYNWEELRDLARPGALSASFFVRANSLDGAADAAVSRLAAAWLREHAFNFAFVYLGQADLAGHAYGWMSDPYLQAISLADGCIGAVLDAVPPACAVLVASDHGGHDQTHGTDAPEDMTVPLILKAAGVPPGTRIAAPAGLVDVAPTVAHLLGVTAPTEWTGTPLTAVRPA